MRTRYLKPGFFENEDLAALPATTRLLFAGLWLMADKSGRLKDRPARIKGELFPYDTTNVDRGLKQLADAGFIKRYVVDDQRLIWIPGWAKNQKPHNHEPVSELPRHSDDIVSAEEQTMVVPSTDNVGTLPTLNSNSNSNPHSNSKSDLDLNVNPDRPKPTRSLKSRLDFDPGEVAKIREQFPNADINGRFREWVSWIEEEEERRMPKDRMEAFMGWLRKREQTDYVRPQNELPRLREVAG